ncbi:MAG: GAF domain-containing protein [Pseudomonadota bacterium]
MTSTSPSPDQQIFNAVIEAGGLDAGLKFLNERTAYRYTAIYRFEGSLMRNIHLYDRQGEDSPSLKAVPLGDSFCQFVMAEDGFATGDSASDGRLDGHKYQGVLNSYFGLPLLREPGKIYGTFCHFDFDPQNIPDSEIPFLEAVMPQLVQHLP